MIVKEAYSVVHGATVTLNYIPVMTPGLYDTFPGHIGWFPGPFMMELLMVPCPQCSGAVPRPDLTSMAGLMQYFAVV